MRQSPHEPGCVEDARGGRSRGGQGTAVSPRPITPADRSGLLDLISTCYAEYGLTLRVEEDEPHLVDPCAYFRSHGGRLWVVADADGVGASVGLLVEGREAELKTLYVHPRLRRQGVGAALTGFVVEKARAAGCVRLFLWSDTRFDAAHRLYERLGFTRLPGERPLHDSNDSREYPFQLLLARTRNSR